MSRGSRHGRRLGWLRNGRADLTREAAFIRKDVIGGQREVVGLSSQQARNRKAGDTADIDGLGIGSRRGSDMDLVPGQVRFGV